MVAPSPPHQLRNKKTKPLGIPVIDLAMERNHLCQLIVKACQEFGVFLVQNHGISSDFVSTVESEGRDFFSKPACEKHKAGPPTPFGYGCKNIGFNGDKGELEYILLEADPHSVNQRSKSISTNPAKFSCSVNNYIEAVRNLASDILEMVGEGLWLEDKSVISKLILDAKSDSCFRINHYPTEQVCPSTLPFDDNTPKARVGFGEHSDPQILTILHSNNVAGLQILSRDGFWIPIPPDSDKFCVFVGDALQALSNGRLVSVRHRALTGNSVQPRMSIMYFAAPAREARITALPELVSYENPCMYRAFTWGEYKATAYSLRLVDHRLDHFRNCNN